jgi:putative acetyltransferase
MDVRSSCTSRARPGGDAALHQQKHSRFGRRRSYLAAVLIREERPADEAGADAVHCAAFGSHADVVVALVRDLRGSLTTEPGLSLVAVDPDERVVGHVLFTRNLLDAPRRLVDVQVLSPLGVLPETHGHGIGGALIRRGIQALGGSGVPAVFLEGAPGLYRRFGFLPAADHGFRRPSLRIPPAAFQVRLLASYAPWMTGTLVYRHAFWRHDAVGLRDSER